MRCEESLADSNTTGTRQLVEAAINITVANVGETLNNSTAATGCSEGSATSEAFKVCEDVLGRAAADLRRTVGKIDFDFKKNNAFMADLRTWLSAFVTNQETPMVTELAMVLISSFNLGSPWRRMVILQIGSWLRRIIR